MILDISNSLATAALLASLSVFPSAVQAQQIQRLDVLDHGIYTTTDKSCRRDASGLLNCTTEEPKLAVGTTSIPAQPKVNFGVRFTVIGAPAKAKVQVKVVWIFPPEGVKVPGSGQPLRRAEDAPNYTIGEVAWATYRFDDPWELVPGKWTVEIWEGDRKLLSQDFTVVTPQ